MNKNLMCIESFMTALLFVKGSYSKVNEYYRKKKQINS